jgi:plastocyanin
VRGSTLVLVLVVVLLATLAGPRARAAGTLTGTVRIKVAPAKAAALPVLKDNSVCGKDLPDETVLVGPERGLANVVVAVRPPKPAQRPAPAAGAKVDQIGCRYVPHVQALPVGTTLSLVNSDAVLHNVHAVSEGATGRTLFNVPMPFKGQSLPAVLKRPGVLQLRCDAGHTWMSAYVAVFDHPYYAVTDARGTFTIHDLPAGEHTVELWHEPAGGRGAATGATIVVRIADGKVTTVGPELGL